MAKAEYLKTNIMNTKQEIQNSKEYKELNDYTAVGVAEGFIESESENQIIAAWQYLHDKGLAYTLQGWFGRSAQSLIQQEVIFP